MVKRWSMALIGKVFVIRDTIEQSVFYIALAVIMLCAVLFLAVPSLTRALIQQSDGRLIWIF